ncbi:MAG: hypothetical protein ACPK85_04425 [Methanosarcina sp.]
MSEYQQMQQSRKPDSTFQKQGYQNSVSNSTSIIQRARINPKSLTPADVLKLHSIIGNRAVGKLLSEVRNTSSTKQVYPVQMQTNPGSIIQLMMKGVEKPMAPQMETRDLPDYLEYTSVNVALTKAADNLDILDQQNYKDGNHRRTIWLIYYNLAKCGYKTCLTPLEIYGKINYLRFLPEEDEKAVGNRKDNLRKFLQCLSVLRNVSERVDYLNEIKKDIESLPQQIRSVQDKAIEHGLEGTDKDRDRIVKEVREKYNPRKREMV